MESNLWAGCSPMNFSVICNDSVLNQRAWGANSRTPSRKRAMRSRMVGSMSRATKRRITSTVNGVHINFLRTISKACCEAHQRTRSRSPGNLRSTTSVDSPLDRAWNTRPTGFSSVPPLGPATPVTASPQVAAQKVARTATHRGDALANQPAGAGFGDGQGGVPHLQVIADNLLQRFTLAGEH